MNLLTKNSKMKKTEKLHPGTRLFDFALPPIKTCPQAGECKRYCYAQQGRFCFQKTRAALQARFEVTQQSNFVQLMSDEIRRRKATHIRIHSTGDFYNAEYVYAWEYIMRLNPNVQFYTYTKSIALTRVLSEVPNFRRICSWGGNEDCLIRAWYAQARVFETEEQAKEASYTIGNGDDFIALTGMHIGLVYHGVKKFNK